ncbi:hypothetical protein LLEC1_05510 [Akanthomyces lecanii]|uniref:GEgh 16 protein n=1 Tax=Cordyceps confragosa TaxID=2714763 RepID=A0A179INF6_CORDF|nr:hypothetical protein LLEC1_05510 [Akanthomyces lecanii]
MRWTTSFIAAAPLFSFGACHAVILNAQGIKGSPASVGFQVDPAVARNCITINPCQQDTTIIREAEIQANVVNICGRTELKGNIDVGENIEGAISSGNVTQVKAGDEVTVTIHQVNADGAGPFFCDIDQTGNSGANLQNLTVLDNVPGSNGLSQAKAQAFDIRVQLPNDLHCTGGFDEIKKIANHIKGSTGNICTIRCRNNAVAGPFGGCFPVQQIDTKATKNNPNTITTKQDLNDVMNQVQINQADFGKAVQANKAAGANEAKQNLGAVNALLAETVTTRKFPQETPSIVLGGVPPQVTNGGDQNGGNQNGGNRNGGDKNGGNKNGGNKNGGNQDGGNQNDGDENGGNKNGGNQDGGNQDGSNKNGGNKNDGNKNGENQNGGNQDGGNQDGGNQDGGNKNSGDKNRGNKNGGSKNGGSKNGSNKNGDDVANGRQGDRGDQGDQGGRGGRGGQAQGGQGQGGQGQGGQGQGGQGQGGQRGQRGQGGDGGKDRNGNDGAGGNGGRGGRRRATKRRRQH